MGQRLLLASLKLLRCFMGSKWMIWEEKLEQRHVDFFCIREVQNCTLQYYIHREKDICVTCFSNKVYFPSCSRESRSRQCRPYSVDLQYFLNPGSFFLSTLPFFVCELFAPLQLQTSHLLFIQQEGIFLTLVSKVKAFLALSHSLPLIA